MRVRLRDVIRAACCSLVFPAVLAAQQATTISGRVRGDAGNPLPGATVSITELGAGGTVRESGEYSFTVPANRVRGQTVELTARIIGYRAVTARVTLSGEPIVHDFTLVSNPFQLGEVVITGAGTATTREKLGTVINTVDSAAIAHSNESNIVNALAAKAPEGSAKPAASTTTSAAMRGESLTFTPQAAYR